MEIENISFEQIKEMSKMIENDTKAFNKTGIETDLLTKVRDLAMYVAFEQQVQICDIKF